MKLKRRLGELLFVVFYLLIVFLIDLFVKILVKLLHQQRKQKIQVFQLQLMEQQHTVVEHTTTRIHPTIVQITANIHHHHHMVAEDMTTINGMATNSQVMVITVDSGVADMVVQTTIKDVLLFKRRSILI